MKQTTIINRFLSVALVLFAFVVQAMAVNTTTTVAQVTTAVDLTTDVDYVITGTTPFGTNGVVDIKNTEHAVLIFSAVKPSSVIKLLSKNVKINGAVAINDSNCQVKLYNRGAIILPYGDKCKPLTVYSENKYEGESSNDFTLGHNGNGFMKNVPTEWNNRISSFKLKRGYMVTFSTLPNGRGYSRCFVAAYEDREIAALPAILNGYISSYRIFKWYDAGKKQLANYMNKEALNALNVQSSYDWGQGNSSFLPDFEWVPNHIYEDWPSSATIGGTSQSPNCKNNNEPRNPSDDHPQDLTTILNNWENMMATGLRLCSPASWDGSDYWNATGFLAEFLDSIDARGWRCDIIDLHCYWPESNFGNVNNWYNKYKRPIWISEWCWGASWNNNGAFANGVTETQVKEALSRICTSLSNNNNVERYYYWNGERDPSKLYKNNSLTPAGEWYSQHDAGLGYKKSYEFIPKNPPMKSPINMKAVYNKANMRTALSWNDQNGEWNKSMVVERSTDGGRTYNELAVITQKEAPSSYNYTDLESRDGYRYRVHIVDFNNTDRYSGVVTATLADPSTGDGVTIDGKIMYIGGNMLVNGDFEMGLVDWTNGAGTAAAMPQFQVVNVNGADAGHHLLSWVNGAETTAACLYKKFTVEPQSRYYFSVMLSNAGGSNQTVKAGTTTLFTTRATTNWLMEDGNFNVGDKTEIAISFRNMDKARMDKFVLCRLFNTREEAFADGVEKALLRARTFIKYNTILPALNAEVQAAIDTPAATDAETFKALDDAVDNALDALFFVPELRVLVGRAEGLINNRLPNTDELKSLIEQVNAISTAAEVKPVYTALSKALNAYKGFSAVQSVQNSNFASTTGWVVTSTYTGGDQRKNTVLGTTCWNAWWSVPTAEVGDKTLGIKQEVNNLPAGFYYLVCRATTQHGCLSDQHGYITNGTVTNNTPLLTCDLFDHPDVADSEAWERLITQPLYLADGETLTVGFESSKTGAQEGSWTNSSGKGDNREGWWCATDFVLYYLPVNTRSADAEGDFWGTICLPQAVSVTSDVQLYEVAGGLTDGDKRYICLEPIESIAAGYPAVFHSDFKTALFFTSGDAVKLPKEGRNTLTGSFTTQPIYSFEEGAVGTIVIENSNFRELTDADYAEGYYTVPKNEAFLYGFADIDQLTSWDGVKMPLNGDYTEGIRLMPVSSNDVKASFFTVDGRRASATARGLIIIKGNGRVRKAFKN